MQTPTSLHELAPLLVQTRIHSSDIDSVWPCHFSILKASYALIWISVRLEVQDSEVRPLWHCRIWPWPQWTIVEQYVSEILIQPCFEHLVVSCVDTSTIGFSLYSRDHLQTSVSQVFTDLDFSGSPVELELVFLAFSWCIGLKSRAHLIQYS